LAIFWPVSQEIRPETCHYSSLWGAEKGGGQAPVSGGCWSELGEGALPDRRNGLQVAWRDYFLQYFFLRHFWFFKKNRNNGPGKFPVYAIEFFPE
jgi:hypothetical protein